MAPYRLTLLPGDGTGREVMEEVKRVLSVFQESGAISLEISEIPCGASIISIPERSGHRDLSNSAVMSRMQL